MVRRQRHLGMGLGFLQWADGLRLGHFHGKVEGDPDGTSLEDIWITSVLKLGFICHHSFYLSCQESRDSF